VSKIRPNQIQNPADPTKVLLGSGVWGASPGSIYTDENARDAIGAALVAGTGVSIAVNDAGDTITITNTLPYTDEQVRDIIGAALVQGAGITITVNDAADTITIASSITQYTDEMARDALGAALLAGTGIGLTVNDPADTITIANTLPFRSSDAWTDITTGNWHSYTGTFAFKAGGTTIAATQYAVDARYFQMDKFVAFQVGITMNAGFSYGGATGVLTMGLPVLPVNRSQILQAAIIRGGADIFAWGRGVFSTDAQIRITGHQASTTDYPTWASGDQIILGGTYQAN
jgi:hypothetical protein